MDYWGMWQKAIMSLGPIPNRVGRHENQNPSTHCSKIEMSAFHKIWSDPLFITPVADMSPVANWPTHKDSNLFCELDP